MGISKKKGVRLRNQYFLNLEIGLLLSLALLIGAFHVDLSTSQDFRVRMEEQETVDIRQIQQTKQENEPPPPPTPPVPVEVPNNQVITREAVNFDASLDMDRALNTSEGPPTPPVEEEEEKEEPEIFVVVEEQPELIGGMAALQKAAEYPEMARRVGIEGRVIVKFVVDENGNVQNPRVTRGVHTLLNKAALNAVKEQKFKPGRQRGQPVKVQLSLPVTFRLEHGQ